MLWVNLIMDSLASLSLATEAPTDEVLDLPPNPSDAPILTPLIVQNIAGQPNTLSRRIHTSELQGSVFIRLELCIC